MKHIYFLIVPFIIILLRIRTIDSIEEIISSLVYILSSYVVSAGLYQILQVLIKKPGIMNCVMCIVLFTVLDMLIKACIHFSNIKNKALIGKYLTINPTRNAEQSGILNLFHIQLDSWLLIVLKLILVCLALGLWMICRMKFADSISINIFGVLFVSAAMCTFLDSLVWGYTLDYLQYKGIFCYDLKDYYVNCAIGCFAIDYFVEVAKKFQHQ